MTPAAQLRLRPATPADAPALAACVEAAYTPWIARVGRKPWPMLQDYAAVVAGHEVVVAELDGALAGLIVLAETDEGFLIDNVAVDPRRKGQGIGRALLLRAEQSARAKGHASVYLYTNEKMTENIDLYLRAGYVEYARREEEGFSRVFLRKALG